MTDKVLKYACKLLADMSGSCPCDLYDWEHPETCARHCKPDVAPDCWGEYVKQLEKEKSDETN